VLPFFDGCGPFKRWIRTTATVSEMNNGTSTNVMPSEVEDLVRSTVYRIRSSGGNVVGIIGFSQGTRVVAGLLRCAEIVKALKQNGEAVDGLDWCDWTFGISICGSYPPPLIAPSVSAALEASKLSETEKKELLEKKIVTPTFHVLGTQDEWKWAGDILIERCYEVAEGKSTVKVLDIGHYYPVQPGENEEIGAWVTKVVKGEKAG
jgi:hypothetical protein